MSTPVSATMTPTMPLVSAFTLIRILVYMHKTKIGVRDGIRRPVPSKRLLFSWNIYTFKKKKLNSYIEQPLTSPCFVYSCGKPFTFLPTWNLDKVQVGNYIVVKPYQ